MFKQDPLKKILTKAHTHLTKNEFIKAKELYLQALALSPNNISIINNLAQLYAIIGDDKKAKGYNEILLEECNKLLKYEKTEELLIFKSNALIALNRKEESNEIIDELLKISPENPIGLLQKSQYLEINHHNKESIKYINKLLKENPYDIGLLLSKGRNLVEIREFKKAEDCYNLVLKIETKNKTAINLKSQLLKKKYNTSLTPHDFMLKAVESWERKDFKSATAFLKKAIALNPDYDEIWFMQGELYIRTGRINDAIRSFKKAFNLNPTSGGIENQKKLFKLLNRMKIINIILGYEKKL